MRTPLPASQSNLNIVAEMEWNFFAYALLANGSNGYQQDYAEPGDTLYPYLYYNGANKKKPYWHYFGRVRMAPGYDASEPDGTTMKLAGGADDPLKDFSTLNAFVHGSGRVVGDTMYGVIGYMSDIPHEEYGPDADTSHTYCRFK